MTTKYSSIEELKREIIKECHRLYDEALEVFPQKAYRLEISFGLSGRVAGRANPMHTKDCHWLEFNLGLAWENPETFLKDTVPHEISHLIADTFFADMWKQGVKHTTLWEFVVKKLGYATQQYHGMAITETSREISKNARIVAADEF